MSAHKQSIRATRWDLLGCALGGHETYQPTGGKQATELAAQLMVETQQGISWRCLRCGNYVPGEPRYSSGLGHAPLVLRGKVLRQTIILRFLAIERGIRAILLIALGFLILHFKSSQGTLKRLLDGDLPDLQAVAHSFGYNLEASKTLHTIQHSLTLGSQALNLAAIVVFAYALLLSIETVGLWIIKRWGEYFSAVATSVFIPIEIYELTSHVTFFKAGALTINVAAVLYLLLTKRLFGIRGGGKAYEAALEGDNLLEITKVSHTNHTTSK